MPAGPVWRRSTTRTTRSCDEVGEVVVKPARGEQGKGITVGVRDGRGAGPRRWSRARAALPRGADRGAGRTATTCGSSSSTARWSPRRCGCRPRWSAPASTPCGELIAAQSRRRARGHRWRVAHPAGRPSPRRRSPKPVAQLDDVLPQGERLRVRRTANLHTGGTIHDVTDRRATRTLPRSRCAAAEAIGIPVTGHRLPGARRRRDRSTCSSRPTSGPGLANHEPQPTAEAFVDFLFPGQPGQPQAWTPDEGRAHRGRPRAASSSTRTHRRGPRRTAQAPA